MATRNVTAAKAAPERRLKNASRVAVLQHAANELVFGLVGPVGSGKRNLLSGREPKIHVSSKYMSVRLVATGMNHLLEASVFLEPA
jgi:hypothetical protein